ncbi:MAG: IS66 family transposase [Pseudomonadota bacterium]
MSSTPESAAELPDDIEALKALVRQQAADYQARINALQEQLNLLLQKRFGPSSEKIPAEQMRLFNEAEAEIADAETEAVAVAGHARKKRGRKPLPASLPRVRVEHDLPESEKTCGCGCHLIRIGEAVSEQLDIIPAQVRVIQHVRPTYACKGCEETIKTAPLPPQPIPKSHAAPGLLAHIAVAKYQDALPLYRQEKILQRIGVDIPRATLAHWMIKLGHLIQPLINLLQDRLRTYDILGMDDDCRDAGGRATHGAVAETLIQVLKEPGREATSNSYLWVQRGGPPDQAVILFHYDPSRGQAVAKDLLTDYRGFIQTDGYEVYGAIAASRSDITLVGCMAHARRKFDEAVKAQGRKGSTQAGKAMMGLATIQKLYRIEKALKKASPEERYQGRREQAKPVLDELRRWLDKSLPEVAPASATGKALNYLHNQWDKLIRYLEDGRLSIDNNATERAIKPFVIGRKNWLFSDTPRGARASANLYSLIETAKANGLEPYHYLRHVFTALPQAQSLEQFEALLPYNVNVAQLSTADVPEPAG